VNGSITKAPKVSASCLFNQIVLSNNCDFNENQTVFYEKCDHFKRFTKITLLHTIWTFEYKVSKVILESSLVGIARLTNMSRNKSTL